MGHYKDSRGIDSFEPDDTDEEFYIANSATLSDIMDRAKVKWPDGWADLDIESEYINTDCLYYDRYDPGDYTRYLKITRIKEI